MTGQDRLIQVGDIMRASYGVLGGPPAEKEVTVAWVSDNGHRIRTTDGEGYQVPQLVATGRRADDSEPGAEPTRTGQLHTYTCNDCGSVGSEPTHHPRCARFHVARLWSSRAAIQAREAMAAWRAANDTFAGTSLAPSAAAEWNTARDAEAAARDALIPALSGLTLALDAAAGIQ